MELGLAPWGESIGEIQNVSSRAEKAGFASLWASELHRSPWVQAAAMVGATTKVHVGTAIALVFVRSALASSLAALDLDDMSDGRFSLGLGSGVRRLNEEWHGAAFTPVRQRFTERVEAIRQMLAQSHLGESIVYSGDYDQIQIDGFRRPWPPKRRVPVLAAAVGPRMARVAGLTADGWIGHVLGSPQYLMHVVFPALDDGLANRKSDLTAGFRRIAGASCVIHDNPLEAQRLGAHVVAFYASVGAYRDFFEWHGFGQEFARIRELRKSGRTEEALEACTRPMVQALTLTGSPHEVREGLQQYNGLVDELKLSAPTYGLPAETTRQLQNRIVALVGTDDHVKG